MDIGFPIIINKIFVFFTNLEKYFLENKINNLGITYKVDAFFVQQELQQ